MPARRGGVPPPCGRPLGGSRPPSWFAEVQGWQPAAIELEADDVRFAGDRAVAAIHLKLQAGPDAGGVGCPLVIGSLVQP